MVFGDLRQADGLKSLDDYLLSRSYIKGYAYILLFMCLDINHQKPIVSYLTQLARLLMQSIRMLFVGIITSNLMVNIVKIFLAQLKILSAMDPLVLF